MNIDVDGYVDNWLNDYNRRITNEYIVYHPQNMIARGDAEKSLRYFDNKYQQARSQMYSGAVTAQVEATRKAMELSGKKAAVPVEIYEKLANGGLLPEVMRMIAQGLNEEIQKAYSNLNYDSIIKDAKKFNSALEQGKMEAAEMDEFFRLLLTGMNAAMKIDTGTIEALTKLGARLSKDSNYKLTLPHGVRVTNNIKTMSQADIRDTQKIVELLERAAERFEKTKAKNSKGKMVSTGAAGTLAQQSFSSTINNIFATVIGEALARRMLAKAVQQGQKDVEAGIDGAFLQLKKMGIDIVKTNSNAFTRGGSRQDEDKRVSKADVFDQGIFKLRVTENGQEYAIDLGTNTSVKWYSTMSNKSEIHVVSGTSFGTYFKPATEERYLAYNTIVHRFDTGKNKQYGSTFHEMYRKLRAATAASFFDQWMSGTGARIKKSDMYLNKVQLLFINGKFYSVMEIIRNICDDLMHRESSEEGKNMPFNMHVSGGDLGDRNEWYKDDKDPPNLQLAIIRAKAVNEVVNKLAISASLNSSILLKYATP